MEEPKNPSSVLVRVCFVVQVAVIQGGVGGVEWRGGEEGGGGRRRKEGGRRKKGGTRKGEGKGGREDGREGEGRGGKGRELFRAVAQCAK